MIVKESVAVSNGDQPITRTPSIRKIDRRIEPQSHHTTERCNTWTPEIIKK
jgi:hypothetical protein